MTRVESGSNDPNSMSASEGSPQLTQAILGRCTQHGFALAGVCRAAPSAHQEHFRAWLAAGSHGEMEYLATDVDVRLDPTQLEPGAQSVICVADRYATGARDARVPGRARIARYARGEDYHAIIRTRLEALVVELRAAFPRHRFRVCVDTAPILEREHAARTGVGRIGKHTLLIGPAGHGSWLALGTIVTTLRLCESVPEPAQSADPCGACTRCIDACPTRAISPWSVDAARCISYLTIEHRGEVPAALGRQVQDWIFGCDICQEVCPHNQPTRRARRASAHPAYAHYHESFDLMEVLGWTDAHWESARLHGALRRASRAMWVRNAALASRASLRPLDGSPTMDANAALALRARLRTIAEDPAEEREIRAAARVALSDDAD